VPRPAHLLNPAVSAIVLVTLAGALAACSTTSGPPSVIGVADASSTIAPTTTLPVAEPVSLVVDNAPMPDDRCRQNAETGTIVVATDAGLSATTMAGRTVAALAAGYFTTLCLDVQLRPSQSQDNYSLVAAGEATFAASASFSELADFAGRNDAGFVAVDVGGYTSLDQLVVAPTVAGVDDLRDRAIGRFGSMPVAVAVMLHRAGLVQPGADPSTPELSFEDVELEAADDPAEQLDDGRLDAVCTRLGDDTGSRQTLPADEAGVRGSFGVMYTTLAFITEHPTAAQDFVRAMRRIAAELSTDDATEVVTALQSVGTTVDPPVTLALATEERRWRLEVELTEPASTPVLGTPLRAEIDQAVAASAFDGPVTPVDSLTYRTLVSSVLDSDGTVIWPGE
jgi:NitT/TauT family transport system substrate-binding protein